VDLCFDGNHQLDDPRRYRRLIGKLIYLTVTKPNITFAVSLLSRFMHERREAHWSATLEFWLKSRVVQEKTWCIRSMNCTHL